jgi:hypothetical protein
VNAGALIAGIALLTACAPAQNGTIENGGDTGSLVSADSRVSLERTPCYGTCPVYRVAITADGTVSFNGERHTMTTGTATAQIEPQRVAALLRQIEAAGFFGMSPKYTMNDKACGLYHTDAPTVILDVTLNGRTHRVEHDLGCGGAPEQLRGLQAKVDSVAGTARWIERR